MVLDFNLMISCRLIAEGTKGIHLRANEITFTPILAGEDFTHPCDIRGRAERFGKIQRAVIEHQFAFFLCVASCIGSAVVDEMKRRHPDDVLCEIARGISTGELRPYFAWRKPR